ncbi:MAG: S-layer homology domain-containing protein [Clostridia bacterium]|nr:S-layer homology domain-containing protein [Clostridia bacterium]
MKRKVCLTLATLVAVIALAVAIFPATLAIEPEPVASIGAVGYDSLQEAIDAASNGDEISLNKDTAESINTKGKSIDIIGVVVGGEKPTLTGSITVAGGEVEIANIKMVTAAANVTMITVTSGSGSVTVRRCEFTVNHTLSGSASVIDAVGAVDRAVTIRENTINCVSPCTNVFRVTHNTEKRTAKVYIEQNIVGGKWQYGIFRATMCDVEGNIFTTTVTDGDGTGFFEEGSKPVAIHYYSYVSGIEYNDVVLDIVGNTFEGLQSAMSIYNIDAFINSGQNNSFNIGPNTFDSCVNAFVQKTGTDQFAAVLAGNISQYGTFIGGPNSVGAMNIKGYAVVSEGDNYRVTKDDESYLFEQIGDGSMQAGYHYFKGLITGGVSDGKTYVVGDSFGLTYADGYGRPYYLDLEGEPYYVSIDQWLHHGVADADRFYLEDGQTIDDTDGEVFLTANDTRYRLNGSSPSSLSYCDERGYPFYRGSFGPIFENQYTVFATNDIYASKFLIDVSGKVRELYEDTYDYYKVGAKLGNQVSGPAYYVHNNEDNFWIDAGYDLTIQTWNNNRLVITAQIGGVTLTSTGVTYGDIKENIGNGTAAIKTELSDSDVIFAESNSLSNAYKGIFNGAWLTDAVALFDVYDQPLGYMTHGGKAYFGYKNDVNYADKNVLYDYLNEKIVLHLISEYSGGSTVDVDRYYVKTGVDGSGIATRKSAIFVTFDSCGGSAVSPSRTVTVSGEPIGSLPAPVRDGYTFDGWFTAADGGTQVLENASISTPCTLYAHWSVIPVYTVTLNGESGSTVYNLTAGEQIALPVYSDSATRKFLGWYDSEGNLCSGTYTVSGNETLTARWSSIVYAVEIASSEGGLIESSFAYAGAGNKGVITVTADQGYELKSLTAVDAKGNAVTLTLENGSYGFTMPASKVTVSAVFEKTEEEDVLDSFDDVDSEAWYADGLRYFVQKGIMQGTPEGKLLPSSDISRAEIAVMLWRMAGCPAPTGENPFTDVKDGLWYTDAVVWAAENGIALGSDGKFMPSEKTTLEQFACFFARYARNVNSETVSSDGSSLEAFKDGNTVSSWARTEVAWAVDKGLLIGDGNGGLAPTAFASRGRIATMLYRYIPSEE